MNETRTFIAKFPLVERAEQFAARITEPGWCIDNVTRKGRTVTFTMTESDVYTEWDLLDTVGYYGSDQRRKATLNGRPAPMSY